MSRTQKKPVASEENLLHRSSRIEDILTLLPEAADLLLQYGLSCAGCHYSSVDTLESGCKLHGFSDEEIDDLLADLHVLLRDRPMREKTITVTKAGAQALLTVLKAQGGGSLLRVQLDPEGGFCLEVADEKEKDDASFGHPEVPDLTIIASPMTLTGIGGSTIDHREGRFKLDLPQDMQKKGCACSEGGSCACKKP